MTATVTVLDAALDALHGSGPSWLGGLANHGPMAAEALVSLGAGDDAARWARWYAHRLEPLADAGSPFLDRLAHISEEIAADGWEAVVRRRVPVLVTDAAAGSAGHGLLRTAHAIRGLEHDDTPIRRTELAHGLAYWELTFASLPGAAPALTGHLEPAAALAQLPETASVYQGFFTDAVRTQAADPNVRAVVDSIASPADLDDGLSLVTEAAASAYVAGAHSGGVVAVALVHAVTVPAATHVLLPYLAPDVQRACFAAAWQASVLLIAGYGAGRIAVPAASSTRAPSRDWRALAVGALAAADEHAIKLTGACALEDGRRPSPVYAAAAGDVITRLREPGFAS